MVTMRHLVAGLTIVALAVAGTVGAGSAAWAAEPTAPVDPASAKALAAALAKAKVGCRDFSPESVEVPQLTNVTLPPELAQLATAFEGASIGTCTVDRRQTLLAVFPTPEARAAFEGLLGGSACTLALFLDLPLPSRATDAQTDPAAVPEIPYVEVGSRAMVLTTGAKSGAPSANLPRANAIGKKIARSVKGSTRKTFALTCT